MSRQKVNIHKLERLLTDGKTVKYCAEYFGVSPAAISQHKKSLNVAVVKNVVMENAHRIVGKNLNAIDQLQKINARANDLLDKAGSDPDVSLKAMSEIRHQLKLQLEIFQTLYDLKAVEAFQHEVLAAIGEVSPDVRERIIYSLGQKRAIRQAIKFD